MPTICVEILHSIPLYLLKVFDFQLVYIYRQHTRLYIDWRYKMPRLFNKHVHHFDIVLQHCLQAIFHCH